MHEPKPGDRRYKEGVGEVRVVPPAPRYQMGEITERDRFLDEASDRRAALMAASRSSLASPGEVLMAAELYLKSLREGKSTA